MKKAGLFASFRNLNAAHYPGQVQFDHHGRGILVPSPTGVLENVEVLACST